MIGPHAGTQTAKLLICFAVALLLFLSFPSSALSAGKWSGVDESVVEKYAREHGRAATAPLINTDQGDLLLFAFLLAGAIGGFAAGYCWRMLMAEKSPAVGKKKQRTGD